MSRCKTSLPVCNCQTVSSLTWGKNGAMTGPVTSSSLSSVTTTFTVEPLKPSTSKESMMQLHWKRELKLIFHVALFFSLMEIFLLQSFSFQVITVIIRFFKRSSMEVIRLRGKENGLGIFRHFTPKQKTEERKSWAWHCSYLYISPSQWNIGC